MAEDKKKKKTKTGATGKKYTQIGDTIKVTYTDGSSRTVTSKDKSYEVTKAAMEKDKKGFLKPAGNSKTTAKTALGSGWAEGDAGVITSASTNKRKQESVNRAKEQVRAKGIKNEALRNQVTQYMDDAKSQYDNKPTKQTAKKSQPSTLQQAKDLNNTMMNDHAMLKEAAKPIQYAARSTFGSLPATIQTAGNALITETTGKNTAAYKAAEAREIAIAAKEAARQQALANQYGVQNFTPEQRLVSDTASGVFGMLPYIGASVINPYLGIGTLAGQIYGQATNSAMAEGSSAPDARRYGFYSMATEGAPELLFRFPGTPGLINAGKTAGKVLGKAASNPVVRAAGNVLGTAAGEAVEEGLTAILDPYAKRASYDPMAPNATPEEIAYQGLIGGLSSVILQGGNAALRKGINTALSNDVDTAQKTEVKPQQARLPQPEQVPAQQIPQPQNEIMQQPVPPVQQVPPMPALQQQPADQRAIKLQPRPLQKASDVAARSNVSIPMEQRDWDNVKDKGVKAYQQENPAVKPIYQETAERLLSDMQYGERGRREVGIDPETRTVTRMEGIKRSQSQPVEAMLKDGMTYKQIEDGLQRIIEDNGKENTTTAKRVELYVDEAARRGYNSIEVGRVSPDHRLAYAGMTREQLQAEMARLDGMFGEPGVDPQEIVSRMVAVNELLQEEIRKDTLTPQLQQPVEQTQVKLKPRPLQRAVEQAPIADAEPQPVKAALPTAEQTIENQRNAQAANEMRLKPADMTRVKPEILEWKKSIESENGTVGGMQVVLVENLTKPNGEPANGMYQDGKVYLDVNRLGEVSVMRYVTGHELFHGIKGTREHGRLIDMYVQYVRVKHPDISYEDMVSQKMEEYSGVIDPNDMNARKRAEDELGAEFIEAIFTDPDIIREINTTQPSLGQKIKALIKRMLDRFSGKSNLNAVEAQQKRILEDAYNLFNSALQKQERKGRKAGNDGEPMYMFAGQNSKGADIEALTRADKALYDGADPNEVRKQTGWHRSKLTGNQWAYEIDDSNAIINPQKAPMTAEEVEVYRLNGKFIDGTITPEEIDRLRELSDATKKHPTKNDGTLKSYLYHPELYEKYPELADMRVELQSGDTDFRAAYNRQKRMILINPKLKIEDFKASLLHEVQHAVQHIEGFPSGASPEYWGNVRKYGDNEVVLRNHEYMRLRTAKSEVFKKFPLDVRDTVTKWEVAVERKDFDTAMDIEEKLYNSDYGELFGEYANIDFEMEGIRNRIFESRDVDLYWNTAGEIMARDTSNRRFMNSEERKKISPLMGDSDTVYAGSAENYAIGRDNNGKKVVVIDADIFKGNIPNKWRDRIDHIENSLIKLAKKNKNNVFVRILENGHEILVDEDAFPGEYAKSKYSQRLNNKIKMVKFKATGNLHEIVEIASNRRFEGNRKGTNSDSLKDRRKRGGIYKYDTSFAFSDGKGTYNVYDAEIVIRRDENGKRYLYDIVKIKERGLTQHLTIGNDSNSGVYEESSFFSDILQDEKPGVNSLGRKNNSLESRLSGDDLLNAQDTITDIIDAGGFVDSNGYATLYHATSKENAEKIKSSGTMRAKEDGLFFSTKKDGEITGYGDSILEFSIPVEKLVMDDHFGDEIHFRMPLKSRNEKRSVSEYLVREANDADGMYSISEAPDTATRFKQLDEKYSNRKKADRKVYTNTLSNSPLFSAAEVNLLMQFPDMTEHDVITNKESLERAAARVEADFDGEAERLRHQDRFSGEDLDVAIMILHKKMKNVEGKGNYAEVIRWAEDIAKKGEEAGRFIQAFAKYSKNTKEGIIVSGVKMAKDVEKAMETNTIAGVTVKSGKARKIERETKNVNEALDQAEQQAEQAATVALQEATAGKKRKSRKRKNNEIARRIYKAAQNQAYNKLEKTVKQYLKNKTGIDVDLGMHQLADKIDARMDYDAKEKPKLKQGQIISELMNVLEESGMPDYRFGRKTDPDDRLRHAIKYKNEYAQIWSTAKIELMERHKHDKDALEILDAFFNKGIVPTYSDKTVRQAVKGMAPEIGLDFKQLVTENPTNRKMAKQQLIDYIIGKVGEGHLSHEDAQNLAEKIYNIYDAEIERLSKAKLDSYFGNSKEAREAKSQVQKITELIHAGLLESEDNIAKIDEDDRLNYLTSEAMKATEMSFNELARKFAKDKEEGARVISNYIMENFDDVTREEAKQIADSVVKSYNKKLSETADRILRSKFPEMNGVVLPSVNAKKTHLDKILELINLGAYDRKEIVDIIKERNDIPVLTSEDISAINKYVDEANKHRQYSYEWNMNMQKAWQVVSDKQPKVFGDMVTQFKRLGMLSNVKTMERNIIGNIPMAGTEAVGNSLVAAPLGAAITGVRNIIDRRHGGEGNYQRTLSANPFAQMPSAARGFAKGVGDTFRDMRNGVDTYRMNEATAGQYEMPRGRMFGNNGGGMFMPLDKAVGVFEKFVNYGLMLGDRPFYHAHFEARMSELERLGYDVTSAEAQAACHAHALEMVYQNDSSLAEGATGLRAALNKIFSVGGFRLGDFVIPFAQTPANIADKIIDMTPAGAARAVLKLGADKLNDKPFDQEAFCRRLGRSVTGTGIVAIGAALFAQGLITGGDPEDDDERRALYASGWRPYSIKIGDSYYDYSFAQPVGALLAIGAEIYDTYQTTEALEPFQIAAEGTMAGVNCLLNMSFLESVYNFFGGFGTPAENMANGFSEFPLQFVPSVSNAVARSLDDYQRETYDPDPGQALKNKIQARLPHASESLPVKLDVYGREVRQNQGRSQNAKLGENLLLPMTYTTTQNDTVNDALLQLRRETGETSQFFSMPDKKLDFGEDNKVVLSAAEYLNFNKQSNGKAADEVERFIQSDYYKQLDGSQKVEVINDLKQFYKSEAKDAYAAANDIAYEHEDKYKQLRESGKTPYQYFAESQLLNAGGFTSTNHEDAMALKADYDRMGSDYNKMNQIRTEFNNFGNIEVDGKKITAKEQRFNYLDGLRSTGQVTDEEFWYLWSAKYTSKSNPKDGYPYWRNSGYDWIKQKNIDKLTK